MVEMTAPTPKDVICDPACGTCGFLVAAGEYLRDNHPKLFHERREPRPFPRGDVPRLRFRRHHAAHRLDEHDAARRRRSRHPLQGLAGAGACRRCRPLFAGPRQSALRRVARLRDDGEGPARDRQDQEDRAALHGAVPEAAEARRARGGDRAGRRAVRLVHRAQGDPPDAGRGPQARRHRQAAVRRVPALCRRLDRDRAVHQDRFRRHGPRLVLRLPGGRLFARRQAQRAAAGGEDRADAPNARPSDEHAKNNLPDIAARWAERDGAERERPRTAQSFCVPKAEIAAAGYDLSINRYKEVVHEAAEHRPPKEIIAELKALEKEIAEGLEELEEML